MDENQEDKDLVLAYVQKFWEAGNVVVTLMFGLAFAVFVLIANSKDIRFLVQQKYGYLVTLGVIGNGLLAFVLYRLWFHEDRLLRMITKNATTIDAVRSAFEIRIGLFAFNFLLYMTVITYVRVYFVQTP